MKQLCLTLLALMLALPAARAEAPKHTETLQVGPYRLSVNFSEYPMRAERSLDLTFIPEGGIAGKSGQARLVQPNGQPYFQSGPLPRFPRDRKVWGFDSFSLPTPGTWKLELTVNGSKATLPLTVLERPAGPPSNLILFLASLPVLALGFIAARAWWRVQPLRRLESRQW